MLWGAIRSSRCERTHKFRRGSTLRPAIISRNPSAPRDRLGPPLTPTLPAVQVPIPHGAHALAKLSDVGPALAPALRRLTSPHRLDQFVCSLADFVNEVALSVQFRQLHGRLCAQRVPRSRPTLDRCFG